MTDWKEAGRKADAHRVRDLYRSAFGSDSKSIARKRVIEAMRAAGVTTVLDLWGGGQSAEELVAAGFRVISVDDGSMVLEDRGGPVSRARKRRALEYAAAEGGYEARFGKAETFAHEADGAYLDFCGPWALGAKRAVQACRHMKAVVVTLVPDHDAFSGAIGELEREFIYQLVLKMAWSARPRWEWMAGKGNVRRLMTYRRSRGFGVFVYLLSASQLRLRPISMKERLVIDPEARTRYNAKSLANYHSLDRGTKRQRADRIWQLRKARLAADPAFRDRLRLASRHRLHGPNSTPKLPCSLCIGRLGPASPA